MGLIAEIDFDSIVELLFNIDWGRRSGEFSREPADFLPITGTGLIRTFEDFFEEL